MNNKMKRVGPIAVYLTREQINALLYLLDCFPAADSNSIFASDAEKLKRKILLHGRTFNDRGDEKVSLYFYENEAAILLKAFFLFVYCREYPLKDYIGAFKMRKKEEAPVE